MTTLSRQYRVNYLFGGLAILLVSASAAAAQSDSSALDARDPFYQPVSPYPVEMGFTQHHSSTAFEGAQRGRAALIQAWGIYQQYRAQAQILWEQARALDRENRLKQTQALHAQQAMWSKARIQAREQREARLTEGQKKLGERRATVYRHVYQLSSIDFNAATGAITWPSVLQEAKYQQVRERVEELFRLQLGYGDPQPGAAKEIARNVEVLRRALRSDVRNLSKEEFVTAAKFLAGLQLEAESLAKTA